jgi:hypothetical protein
LTILAVILATAAPPIAAQPARFAIFGDAQLATDARVQTGGRFELEAQFTAADVPAALAVQTAGRFTMNAVLSTSSLVCYNDTIFRDSFDGTGL